MRHLILSNGLSVAIFLFSCYTKREALFNFYLLQGKLKEHNLEAQGLWQTLVKLFTMFLIHSQ